MLPSVAARAYSYKIMFRYFTKRAVSVVLIFALLFCVVPVNSSAADDGENILKLNFREELYDIYVEYDWNGNPYDYYDYGVEESFIAEGYDSELDLSESDIHIPADTPKSIPKLYVKTIDAGDELLLENIGVLHNEYNEIDEDGHDIGFNLIDGTWDFNNGGRFEVGSGEPVQFPINSTTKVTLTQLTDAGIPEDAIDKTASAYYFLIEEYRDFALLVQEKGAQAVLDTSELDAQLARVSDGNGLLSDDFYTENDRFNGKEYTKDGAWAELTKANGPYEKAKNQYVKQEEVNKAASDLKTAIDRLIPKALVNPTLLYEELNTKWEWDDGVREWLGNKNATFVTEDNTTAVTWQPYAAALKEGKELLASLYDEDGNPTEENKAALQPQVEALAETLSTCVQNLVNKSTFDSYYKYYIENREKALDALEKYNPANYTESDYTAESWAAFTEAYAELKADMEYNVRGTGTKEEYDVLKSFSGKGGQINALISTVRSLESAVDITLSGFTFIDNGGVFYSQKKQRYKEKGSQGPAESDYVRVIRYTDAADLSISADLSNANALINERIKPNLDDRFFRPFELENYWGVYMIFVNGEFTEMSRIPKTRFHNGDDVKIVYLCTPAVLVEASTGLTTSSTQPYPVTDEADFADSVADIKMTAPIGEIKVGEEVEFSATLTGAYPLSENFGKQLNPENISLFISKPFEKEDASATTIADKQPTINTGKKTGSDGKLTYAFTEPGTYAVALYDVEPDNHTFTDIYMVKTIGSYNSVKAGDFAYIKVEPADDENALIEFWKDKYQKESEEYFNGFHDYDFAGNVYSDFVGAYWILTDHISSANTFKDLVDNYKNDFEALKKVGENTLDHAALVENLRKKISYLPEDEEKLDKGYTNLINGIRQDFEAMNDHTKALFTPTELERIEKILAIDVNSMPAQAGITVSFQSDYEASQLFQAPPSGDTGNPYRGWPNLTWVTTPNDDGSVSNPRWDRLNWTTTQSAKTRDHVFARRYAPKLSDDQYWMMWSVDGGQTWNEAQREITYKDGAPYGYFVAEYVVPEDIENGSTIEMQLKSISRTEYDSLAISGIRADAIDAVKAAYDEYSKDAKAADKEKLGEIRDKALADIAAATTEADVTKARKAAVGAMAAAVKAASGESTTTVPEESFNAGKQIGTVSLIIENTTYSGAPFTGIIAKGEYPLCEKDSMMTVVLKALEAKGFNWNGTLGDVGNAGSSSGQHDYSITYLGSINKGEGKELGEFDGGRKSGWMGTLNDWFVSESFAGFTVENGRLESGDEIHVMYTCDMGADIGGTWGANDTTIDNLSFSAGRLAPKFDSGVTEYMLIIPSNSANLKIGYKVNNMNYQSRIFLNSYNKESARYKKSDIIPVKSGDKLYIGVGDPSWPSMNSSGKPTKYIISVYTMEDALAALPAASSVKMANYKTYVSMVDEFEAAIKANGYTGSRDKLKELKEAVTFYSGIEKVKDLLSAIPAADKLSKSDRSKVEAAKKAYDALTDEQKKYITVADSKKYNDAVEWLEKQGISTGGRINGSEVAPEEIEQTVLPTAGNVTETVKVEAAADANGVAKAKVDTKTVSDVIKKANEDKADSIVIAADVKGDAKEIKVALEKTAVNEIANSTKATFVVETGKGSLELPSETFGEISKQAGNSGLEISVAETKTDAAELKEAVQAKLGNNVDAENLVAVEIKVNSGETAITQFGGKAIKANISVDGKKNFVEGKVYPILVISSNGKQEILPGMCYRNADGKLEVGVKLTHLSTFVVLDKEIKTFADAKNHWSSDAVNYVVANGLMNGTSDTAFAPNAALSRAMLVTILYRLAGSPEAASANGFSDIASGQWYTDAVAWAAGNGIVTGKSETRFAPMENITREQFATMLMRYCKFKGADTSKTISLDSFTDNASISGYAKEALAWANASGIITGRTATTIAPAGNATRGEAATMLMRFLQAQ